MSAIQQQLPPTRRLAYHAWRRAAVQLGSAGGGRGMESAERMESSPGSPRRLSICLINPKFELSFWGYDFVLPMMPGDKRCYAVTAALPALAALAPPDCAVELIDENVEPIDFAKLERFDVKFIGEAEETWPAFLAALAAGEPVAARYEQAEKTDMRRVPPPRYDLLKTDRYVLAALQFSRGCPFLCEFCDIITIFGRRPRR